MKVVIAPDSFKESLSAAEVAAALAEGVIEADPQASVDLCPLADGGPGTVAAMVSATGGAYQDSDVFGPLGSPVRARWGCRPPRWRGSRGGIAPSARRRPSSRWPPPRAWCSCPRTCAIP